VAEARDKFYRGSPERRFLIGFPVQPISQARHPAKMRDLDGRDAALRRHRPYNGRNERNPSRESRAALRCDAQGLAKQKPPAPEAGRGCCEQDPS